MLKFVKIPKSFSPYEKLLVSSGYAEDDTSVVVKLIEDGLVQLLAALSSGPRAIGPEIEVVLDDLRTCEADLYAIPSDFRGATKLAPLSARMDIPENLALQLLWYVGLYTEGYYFLRHEVPAYETDLSYREMVDDLPHNPSFESKEEVPEGIRVLEDDEDLIAHEIQ